MRSSSIVGYLQGKHNDVVGSLERFYELDEGFNCGIYVARDVARDWVVVIVDLECRRGSVHCSTNTTDVELRGTRVTRIYTLLASRARKVNTAWSSANIHQ